MIAAGSGKCNGPARSIKTFREWHTDGVLSRAVA
jgi:hypothetical protein